MFLAELNNLPLWGADGGNAYLQALTQENLYIVVTQTFGELQGHVLVVYKVLYGGVCWHHKPFHILQQMDFLTPLHFWEEDTSELTAKTKGSDRISPKMFLSLPLFDKSSTPNGQGCVPILKGFVPIPKGCVPTPRGCILTSCLKEKFYP